MQVRSGNSEELADLPGRRRQPSRTLRLAPGGFPSMARCVGRSLVLGAVLLLVAACEEEQEVIEEIRSIKTVTVGELTIGQVRKFSGIVRAVDRSALSFEVGGNVLEVNVDIGSRVEQGQILATLDEEPYRLEVEKAEAELVTARAKVKNKEADFKREKSVFEQGAGSARRMDQAEFAFKEAKASVDFAVSKLNLEKRDLRKTVLYAPYNGTIGARQVEPFVEVRRGQVIFEIDADGDKEVEVGIPETTVHLVSTGMSTVVTFPTLPGEEIEGKVTDVGTLAREGNAFPVKVRLLDPPVEVRSGMTAEATFNLESELLAEGYLVPGHALTPTTEASRGFVFVYQPDTSTVKKTPVHFRGVKDNQIIISEGVAPGDVVAVAGVSFLSDGMKVKLMAKPQIAKPETFAIE